MDQTDPPSLSCLYLKQWGKAHAHSHQAVVPLGLLLFLRVTQTVGPDLSTKSIHLPLLSLPPLVPKENTPCKERNSMTCLGGLQAQVSTPWSPQNRVLNYQFFSLKSESAEASEPTPQPLHPLPRFSIATLKLHQCVSVSSPRPHRVYPWLLRPSIGQVQNLKNK